MRATLALARGFWGRSLEEFKRQANIALTLEGVKGPSGPRQLKSFDNPESVQECKVMSDVDIGGRSEAHLDWIPSPPSSGYARFHGTISTELPQHRPDIKRTGYAAWRTEERKATIFGRSLWDIDSYAYLALRLKSDGRSYFINVQTESVIPTDLHQHRLFAKRPGEWETVMVKWNDFVRTNHGIVVEPQTEILRQKVRTIGLGSTDRVPGPFELCIQSMWATNDLGEGDYHEQQQQQQQQPNEKQGELLNKQGHKVAWPGKEAVERTA